MLRRNRSRGSTVRRTTNNGGHHNGTGRSSSDRGVYERPESRPRHAVASQNYERYMNQAKDALSSGDRVQAEYYYQHADHFLRILNEYREQRDAQQANQAAAQQQNQGQQTARLESAQDIVAVAEVAVSAEPTNPELAVQEAVGADVVAPVKAPPRRQPRKPKPKVDAEKSEA